MSRSISLAGAQERDAVDFRHLQIGEQQIE